MNTDSAQYHIPILLSETVDALQVKKDGLYFDGTLGGGGHSLEIMKRGGRIIATDRDDDALTYAKDRFEKANLQGRFTLIKGNFKDALTLLKQYEVTKLDGALLDLGISSHQIDEPERGFSYRFDARLDMRMDRQDGFSAYDVVNYYDETRLADVIFQYGEERYSRSIAKNIVKQRTSGMIETTGQLCEIIKKSMPFNPGGHPAKKTFQALRIEVNGELNRLKDALSDITGLLKPQSRFAVITFHSLEDRIVKEAFRELSTGCICDKSLPVCVCGHLASVRALKKIKPTQEETIDNSRSKSATLRIIEKL